MSETTSATLTCPKCQGAMRSYERSGVVIDQCSDCRGIFLDAGELERLSQAENAHYGQQQGYPPPPQQGYPPAQQGYPQQGGFLGQLFGGHHGGGYRRGHH